MTPPANPHDNANAGASFRTLPRLLFIDLCIFQAALSYQYWAANSSKVMAVPDSSIPP